MILPFECTTILVPYFCQTYLTIVFTFSDFAEIDV